MAYCFEIISMHLIAVLILLVFFYTSEYTVFPTTRKLFNKKMVFLPIFILVLWVSILAFYAIYLHEIALVLKSLFVKEQ